MKAKILAILMMLFFTACAPKNQPLDEVTVQLKWVHQAQFAGYYVAEAQGYYKDANLKVTLKPGGASVDLFAGAINQDVDFAVVAADNLIIQRARGAPLKAVATIFRINPFVLVSFADSNILTPYDFPGHTISLTQGNDEAQFLAMLSKLEIDPAEIQIIPYEYDNAPFLNGEVDVTSSYAAGSLLRLEEQAGERPLHVIWPGDYGMTFYADTIVVNEAFLASHPDVIRRFLQATFDGYRDMLENPEAAIDATMRYAQEADADLQLQMLYASTPLIYTGKAPIGWMEPEVWHRMHAVLVDQEILTTVTDIDAVYTLEFIEQIYADR